MIINATFMSLLLCRSVINIYYDYTLVTSGYARWFTAVGAIRISHYDVIEDVITRKL